MNQDVGYLSNKRMALEIGLGLAELSGRTLSLPVDSPIGWGPNPAIDAADAGTPSSLRDLYELPVPVMGDDEFRRSTQGTRVRTVPWPDLHTCVLTDRPDEATEDFAAFALDRTVVRLDPSWGEDQVIAVPARGLATYSFFFDLDSERRIPLFQLLEKVRPKPAYREFAEEVVDSLGSFNAVHIRRTDHLSGVPQSRGVTPWMIRDNLARVFPADQRLVVCSEADPASAAFALLADRFDDIVFLSSHVLEDPARRARFGSLPCHDDSALALVTQEVAARAERFVGTFGSTFTGMIHRQRCLTDPAEPFRFTGDFLGGDTRFERCEYISVRDGPYTWNRHVYPVAAESLAWMREWPEVALENR